MKFEVLYCNGTYYIMTDGYCVMKLTPLEFADLHDAMFACMPEQEPIN